MSPLASETKMKAAVPDCRYALRATVADVREKRCMTDTKGGGYCQMMSRRKNKCGKRQTATNCTTSIATFFEKLLRYNMHITAKEAM